MNSDPSSSRTPDAVAPVHVGSEVGRLRRVLVHEPGPEVDQMVPAMMEELLFDDILYGEEARNEHRRFRRALQLLGVEVLESLELLETALTEPAGRAWVEEHVLEHLAPDWAARFEAMDASEAADVLVGGGRRESGNPTLLPEDLFWMRPLPNWCFQRDTQVVLGDAVLFSAMASPARHRETLLSRAIFRFHPDLAATDVIGAADLDTGPGAHVAVPAPGAHDAAHELHDAARENSARATLEGGDILVLSPDVIVAGCSRRTSPDGIEALAEALHRTDDGPRWLLRVDLPDRRAFMHLDTLFTPVDHDAALVYPPVILPGHPSSARVIEYDLHALELRPTPGPDLLSALDRRGLSYEPIPCGGKDPMDQQREQWTDGANGLALAPGVVMVYDRNVRTAEEMDSRGFRVITVDELLLGATEASLDTGERICLLTPSNELSRARGGPHCLTHPLLRD